MVWRRMDKMDKRASWMAIPYQSVTALQGPGLRHGKPPAPGAQGCLPRKCEQPDAALRACRHNGASMPSSSPASPDSHTLRLVLILGLLSAIGPFAIDMYLPALPQIGSSLG
jgi:hypothetical protein